MSRYGNYTKQLKESLQFAKENTNRVTLGVNIHRASKEAYLSNELVTLSEASVPMKMDELALHPAKLIKVGIHQPNFLPWDGYFEKMRRSDIFIILDDVQYSKQGLTNRVLLSKDPKKWLTLPVENSMSNINETKIFNPMHKVARLGRTLSYEYPNTYKVLEDTLGQAHEGMTISDFNIGCIKAIAKHLGIDTPIVLSSELNVSGKKGDKVLNLCKAVGADIYISGTGGAKYIDQDDFVLNGVSPRFDDYGKLFTGESVIINIK